MRDNFSARVKDLLAKRVGYRCSNPSCRQPTSGPHNDITKVVNVGVAAHITAAAFGGPRYDPSLTSKQRISADNGIWLCQKCAKLIDSDAVRYTLNKLNDWKRRSEVTAIYELQGDTTAYEQNIPNALDKSHEKTVAYKSFFDEIKKASSIITTLFNTDQISIEEKQEIAYEIGLKVAELADFHSFYLGHEVIVHVVGTFVEVGDMLAIEDFKARQDKFDEFSKSIRNAYRMIESVRDTGKLNPLITTPLLEHFKFLKAIQDKEDQKY